MAGQDFSGERCIAGFDGGGEGCDGVFGSDFEVELERGPGGEAVLSGDDVEGVSEFGRGGGEAGEGGGVLDQGLTEESAGLIFEVFEAGARG